MATLAKDISMLSTIPACHYDNPYLTITLARPVTDPRLHDLCHCIDDCDGSEDYLRVIRKIARIADPQVVEVLAALIDSPGVVGREAVRHLVRLGACVLPEMTRVLDKSCDEDALVHAQAVIDRVERAAIKHAA